MIKNPLTLDDYLDAARKANGLTSDRQLDKMLGFKAPSTNQWRTGRTLPSDESMVHLARLAGTDVSQALLQLDIWRAESKKEFAAAAVYKTILDTLKSASKAAAVIVGVTFVSLAARDAHAVNITGTNHNGLSPMYTLCDIKELSYASRVGGD